MPNILSTLFFTLLPVAIVTVISGGVAYLVSRLNIPYALAEWLPWRAALAVLILWWAQGAAGIRIFGLGNVAALVTNVLIATLVGLFAVFVISLESSPEQRAVNTVRSVVILAFAIGLEVGANTGAGGLGFAYQRAVALFDPAAARLAMVQIGALALLLDVLGAGVQAAVAGLVKRAEDQT